MCMYMYVPNATELNCRLHHLSKEGVAQNTEIDDKREGKKGGVERRDGGVADMTSDWLLHSPQQHITRIQARILSFPRITYQSGACLH